MRSNRLYTIIIFDLALDRSEQMMFACFGMIIWSHGALSIQSLYSAAWKYIVWSVSSHTCMSVSEYIEIFQPLMFLRKSHDRALQDLTSMKCITLLTRDMRTSPFAPPHAKASWITCLLCWRQMRHHVIQRTSLMLFRWHNCHLARQFKKIR